MKPSAWVLAFALWTIGSCFPSTGSPEEFDIPPLANQQTLCHLQIWATEYHVVLIKGVHGDIPLLDRFGKHLGPQLTPLQFCTAALEGTVRIDNSIFNQDGE